MEEMKKMIEESKTKTEIIKMLSENVNRIISENKKSDTDNQISMNNEQRAMIFKNQGELLKY